MSFDVGAFAALTEGVQSITVAAQLKGSTTSERIDIPAPVNQLQWYSRTFSFTADSNLTGVMFIDASQSTDGMDLWLDNVHVAVE